MLSEDGWGRIAGQEYAATGVFVVRSPDRKFLGKAKINRTITLSDRGQSFTFHGRATVHDLPGKVQASFPVTTS